MPGKKQLFICTNCSYEHAKWLGRCPSCGNWNSFQEENPSKGSAGKQKKTQGNQPVSLDLIEEGDSFRIFTNISELDRVLGGGVVSGSTVLVGGEPGIGKSTLMLQLLASLRSQSVLYVSGEESAAQIKNRANRLEMKAKHIHILTETVLEEIQRAVRTQKPDILVIDSIQTLISEEIGPVPGSVNQVKYGCLELVQWAKETGGAVFLVGHVTKDGALAGPKVVEHMVDTVLYFDQGQSGLRLLRAVKNRFGSVDELGMFTMEQGGLQPVADPASHFLVHRENELPQGITSAAVCEGTRAYLVELQALTVDSKGGYSRVYSDKIDIARVSRVAAVMEKHLGISFSGQDIYVHVAGGIRLQEVGIELPLALALYSARSGRSLPRRIASSGELSLAGEIRPTPFMDRRIKTASEMGFHHLIGPVSNGGGTTYHGCVNLQEALRSAYGS